LRSQPRFSPLQQGPSDSPPLKGRHNRNRFDPARDIRTHWRRRAGIRAAQHVSCGTALRESKSPPARDAHIFCTPGQINSEAEAFCDLLSSVYRDFGFEEVTINFADRPPVRAGDDATWDRAEAALMQAVEAAGIPFEMNPGEGAFYGPKLEFVLRDAIGRDWQCGTLQVDFVLPERLDASYVGEDGEKHRPVMLHRAILGSFERFIGILIEENAGRLPLWLAPVQVMVATVVGDADAHAEKVAERLAAAGLRVETDLRNEKIAYKVREHSTAKIPVIAVVGRSEAEENTVSLRRLGGKTQEVLALEAAVDTLSADAASPIQQ